MKSTFKKLIAAMLAVILTAGISNTALAQNEPAPCYAVSFAEYDLHGLCGVKTVFSADFTTFAETSTVITLYKLGAGEEWSRVKDFTAYADASVTASAARGNERISQDDAKKYAALAGEGYTFKTYDYMLTFSANAVSDLGDGTYKLIIPAGSVENDAGEANKEISTVFKVENTGTAFMLLDLLFLLPDIFGSAGSLFLAAADFFARAFSFGGILEILKNIISVIL